MVMLPHVMKSRVNKVKTETRVFKLKKNFAALRRTFSINVCTPWPETVPAPLDLQCSYYVYLNNS